MLNASLSNEINVNLSNGKGTDLSNLQAILDLKAQMENELAMALADKVNVLADITLHSSKEPYINALSVRGNTLFLDVSNFLVHMIEEGNESFDLKKSLLNSPKAKVGKNGQKYIVVPLSKFKAGRYNWRDRNTGQFSKGTTSGDTEFRVVSEKSDPNIFIHPGYQGQHFIDKAIESFDMNPIIDKYMDMIF